MKPHRHLGCEYLARSQVHASAGKRANPRVAITRPSVQDQDGTNAPMLLNADMFPEIMIARELEAFIRIYVKTIYAYVRNGRIPYVRMGSNLRFCKREILAWLEERHYRP